MTATKPLTYETYLKIPELLQLQKVQSDPEEHDELLFIIIHQAYELWFRLLLHELDKVCRDFDAGDLFGAIATFKRCRTVMKTLVGQLDILETMTPMNFTSFRDRLDTSSGFQSTQFREFEFVLGYKRSNVMKLAGVEDCIGAGKAFERLAAPSVVDHFYTFLEHQGGVIPPELKERDLTTSNTPNDDVQKILLDLYMSRPDLGILFELMCDFDEGLQEWRYRHVQLVSRTIGMKSGTGGSLGTEFLKKSLFLQVFPDLWAIRRHM